MSLGGYGTDNLIAAADARKPLRNGFYAVQSEPTYGNSALISFGYDSGSQTHIIARQGGTAPIIGICGSSPDGDFGNWAKIYTEFQKPTALDVGAVPYRVALGADDLNSIKGTKYGRFCQPLTANATAARHYPITEAGALDVHQTSANGAEACVQEYRSFMSQRVFLRSYNPSGSAWTEWCEFYTTAKKPTAAEVGAIPLSGSTAVTGIVRSSAEFQTTSSNSYRMVGGNYGAFWRQDGSNLYLMLTNSGDQYGGYNSLRPLAINLASGYITLSRLSLTDWTNFDVRYQAKGNYTPAGQAYTKDQSDAKYQLKGNYALVGASYTKAESDGRYQTKGNYISAMRLGSQAGANNNNSGWAMAPGGAVLTGSYQDANYTAVYYRYPQYQLNGSATWYNTGAAQ
ncbi:hypothetical protein [Enterobacter asburiae]|uniref:pyocin knob domain-containing protein n=1 Tax=Enterobacter asburiae TaxID=61645 RepID=UPI003BDA5D91